MFYSHEILTNSQYGVATIWLVATVGKGTQRKLNRKAIQEVDLPRACGKIIDPGAPLALRLQGNLLYGVSRVFSQQTEYMLSDLERTQADMLSVFRALRANQADSFIDPRAGKGKKHQIDLQDDPDFDPMAMFPRLDMISWDNDAYLDTHTSSNRYSQYTPLVTQLSISSGRHSGGASINLPDSIYSGGSFCLPDEFGYHSPSLRKSTHEPDPFNGMDPFNDDLLGGGVGLNFDGDGNLIGIMDDDLELPPLPGSHEPVGQVSRNPLNDAGLPLHHLQQELETGVLILGEEALPDADAFPARPVAKSTSSLSTPAATTTSSTVTAKAPLRRATRRRVGTMIDTQISISTREMKSWRDDYLENMETLRSVKYSKPTTQGQAKINARAFLYGRGIAGVGADIDITGLNHPLANDFAGKVLQARLLGQDIDALEDLAPPKRGRRRKSEEAFSEDGTAGRNVRQKSDEGSQVGRQVQDNQGELMLLGDDVPEVGMEAVAAIDDQHSSMMPWSRPPSVIRGSSIRGSAQKIGKQPTPSPLVGRGSVVRSIERHSDAAMPAFGSDDFGAGFPSDDSYSGVGAVPFVFGNGNNTQIASQGLDSASQQFLGYTLEQAQTHGEVNDNGGRYTVNFDKLADPETHSKSIAAQAFLHVLTLATKGVVSVKQDGIDDMVPFGRICISLPMTEDQE